jgi:hypothetical protein
MFTDETSNNTKNQGVESKLWMPIRPEERIFIHKHHTQDYKDETLTDWTKRLDKLR